MAEKVIEILRRFLPGYLAQPRPLTRERSRAIWAWLNCRTRTIGGHVFACPDCREKVFAYHSCNHRSCPQCGSQATASWVERELQKRVGAPYFMVTFTLPQEIRPLFFGEDSREIFDLFFRAAAQSLREKLAHPRWLGAAQSGFTAVLHTWNQKLGFHPHLHFLVPAAGLDQQGKIVIAKSPGFLVPVPVLTGAFRAAMKQALASRINEIDPSVWRDKKWAAVHIQPCGRGSAAIKYLGQYVTRSAIHDRRLVTSDQQSVTFRWKDRHKAGRQRLQKISGEEFITRLLRHVLPKGLRAVRYYGWCHPASKVKREKIALATGRPLLVGNWQPAPTEQARQCPRCTKDLHPIDTIPPRWQRNIQPAPT